MCGIVSSASTSTAILTHSLSDAHSRPLAGQSRRGSRDRSTPDILYRDDNFTVYEERDNAVSSRGHIILCFNLHVPSIYALSSSDVPLLIQLQDVAAQLLSYFTEPGPSPLPSPNLNPQLIPPPSPVSATSAAFPRTSLAQPQPPQYPFHIGFITPPLKDPKLPIGDHLHAHAFIGDMDQVKWYEVPRKVAFTMGWWAIDDLIAEIREQTSNNRVKSGGAYNAPRSSTSKNTSPTSPYATYTRPINRVPAAGTREGLPNGMEVTSPTIQVNERDLEAGRLAGEGHEEITLSPPMVGTPRIMTTSPPPLVIDAPGSAGGSGSGGTEWSVISPVQRPSSSRSGNENTGEGSGTGPGEASATSEPRVLISPPPPERPISALEI